MKSSFIIILGVFAVLGVSEVAGDDKSEQKLKIGVKKRVENCSIRSKKGDLLHIHYTVIRISFSYR